MCNQFIVSTSKVRRSGEITSRMEQSNCATPSLQSQCLEQSQQLSSESVVLRQALAELKRRRLEGGAVSIQMAEAWNALGLIRLHMECNAESARDCHLEALRIVKQLGAQQQQDRRLLAITLHDIGYCLERLEQRDLALERYKEAIETLEGEQMDQTHPRMIATQRAMNRVLRT